MHHCYSTVNKRVRSVRLANKQTMTAKTCRFWFLRTVCTPKPPLIDTDTSPEFKALVGVAVPYSRSSREA